MSSADAGCSNAVGLIHGLSGGVVGAELSGTEGGRLGSGLGEYPTDGAVLEAAAVEEAAPAGSVRTLGSLVRWVLPRGLCQMTRTLARTFLPCDATDYHLSQESIPTCKGQGGTA